MNDCVDMFRMASTFRKALLYLPVLYKKTKDSILINVPSFADVAIWNTSILDEQVLNLLSAADSVWKYGGDRAPAP